MDIHAQSALTIQPHPAFNGLDTWGDRLIVPSTCTPLQVRYQVHQVASAVTSEMANSRYQERHDEVHACVLNVVNTYCMLWANFASSLAESPSYAMPGSLMVRTHM